MHLLRLLTHSRHVLHCSLKVFIALLILGPLNIYPVVFLALLLMTIYGQDDTGVSKECEDAPYVPGHNLAGEGFDVVTMERKGNGTCKLRKKKYMNGIKQKLPAAVVDWRALPKCSMKVSSQIFESSEALVNDSSSALSVSWKVGLDVKAVGAAVGSIHSRKAKLAMTKSKEDKYSFTKHEVGCSFYSSMFNEHQTDIIKGNINGEDLLFSGSSHPNSLKNGLSL
uniref:Uncharacterized protein n=1 Tax=Sinocyclocheilus rhinocerous TaxID=307959 RepID=A0A673KI54_9TELE